MVSSIAVVPGWGTHCSRVAGHSGQTKLATEIMKGPVKVEPPEKCDKAIASGQLSEPFNVEVNPAKTVAVASIAVKGKGTDAASNHSLAVLRTTVVPASVGKLPD